MYSDYKALIVGFGSIGHRHWRNLTRLGVKDVHIVRRSSSNPNFPTPEQATVSQTLDTELLENIDFAIVCTPSTMHVDAALQLLDAGVPCLIEKPLHNRIDESVERLLRVAESTEAGGASAMAYCMRFNPAYATAFRLLNEGSIGKVLYGKTWFESYMPSWHPWEDYRHTYAAKDSLGGGALRTLDHEIDFLNWTLGETVSSIGARFNRGALSIQSDEVAHLISNHASGASSQVTLSFCRRDHSRGFEFIGADGTITFSHQTQRLCLVINAEVAEVHEYRNQESVDQMYLSMLDNFLMNLGGSKSHQGQLAPVRSGYESLRVIEGIVGDGDGSTNLRL